MSRIINNGRLCVPVGAHALTRSKNHKFALWLGSLATDRLVAGGNILNFRRTDSVDYGKGFDQDSQGVVLTDEEADTTLAFVALTEDFDVWQDYAKAMWEKLCEET